MMTTKVSNGGGAAARVFHQIGSNHFVVVSTTLIQFSDDDPFSFDGFDMPDVGGFFKNTMNSISDYMPALPFSGDDYDDEEEKKDESKNNDENVSIRRPKFENTLKKIFRQTKYKQRRWFDKFFFSSDEETTTTEEPNEATTERSKILNWLKLTERSVPFHTTSTTTQSLFLYFIKCFFFHVIIRTFIHFVHLKVGLKICS